MPSTYTTSARFTLQATGENNNTWGVILNSGVFQLVDDNINGRLAFNLSGAKVLTSALGVTDEARMAFLDVTGGTGGVLTIPAVAKGYFVRSGAAADVTVSAGGATSAVFATGDAGPCFADGANVYGLRLGGKTIRAFITDANQAVIDYVNLTISQNSVSLPGITLADVGKALLVRNVLGSAAWIASPIQISDVVGAEDFAVAMALTL